jgi:Protein of unknown function (DUF4058)
MPSPFPGMDPFLEKPSSWADVHHELISVIRATLTDLLQPRYFVQIEERVYISTEDDPGRTVFIPDVHILSRLGRDQPASPIEAGVGTDVAEPLILKTLVKETIREYYLEVIDPETRRVVTVIELLRPANKVARSSGLKSFRRKRLAVMNSASHWVEIDLLRRGVSLALRKRIRAHDYFVHVSPVNRRPDGLVWLIRLSERLPKVSIPLRPEDDDVRLDLQTVLNTAYDRAGYEFKIDYTKEPDPPLSPEASEWAQKWLQNRGMRPS